MTKLNTARKTFASNVAPKLSAITEPMVTLPGGGTMKLSEYMSAVASATAPASKPATKKAPAPVVTLPVTKSEPVVQSGPVDYVLKAKETACFAAARAATKAAGLAYDAKTNPTGGKFGPNREAYWTCFWAGYNAKATEIGLPVKAPKAK